MKTARLLAGLAILLCAASVQAATPVSSYPDRPIRVIVPFGPGTGTDILARTLTEDLRAGTRLELRRGQPRRRLRPDRRRACRESPSRRLYGIPQHQHPALREPVPLKKINYDPIKDFAAVCRIIHYGFILVVNPNSKISTVPELLALREIPAGEDFLRVRQQHRAGERGVFRQGGEARLDLRPLQEHAAGDDRLIGGQVLFMFVDMASSQGHVKAGRLRAIGVMSDQRSKLMPDLPAVGETVPGFDTTPWAGFFVPAGTSKAIISRLSSETVKTINKPAINQKLTELGLEPVPSGPEELDKFVQQQLKNWGQKIRDAGIQPE